MEPEWKSWYAVPWHHCAASDWSNCNFPRLGISLLEFLIMFLKKIIYYIYIYMDDSNLISSTQVETSFVLCVFFKFQQKVLVQGYVTWDIYKYHSMTATNATLFSTGCRSIVCQDGTISPNTLLHTHIDIWAVGFFFQSIMTWWGWKYIFVTAAR